ncbi:MAG: hypothetical protein ABJG15_04150 [Hyphomonadaceae bacterium]|uniref:hypothetical protein n=1 Tax=Hyphomonas sp. TaxID=87 RepID=UPI00328394F1
MNKKKQQIIKAATATLQHRAAANRYDRDDKHGATTSFANQFANLQRKKLVSDRTA